MKLNMTENTPESYVKSTLLEVMLKLSPRGQVSLPCPGGQVQKCHARNLIKINSPPRSRV
jgi:hypothetical protein